MMLAARPSPALQRTVDFLTDIDLQWCRSPGASGFTEGIDIVDGTPEAYAKAARVRLQTPRTTGANSGYSCSV